MNDAELYRKFEEYFTDHGLTFDQAAEMIDVSRSSLFNWKNGKTISKRARMAMRALIAEPENLTPQKRPGDCSYDVPAPVKQGFLDLARNLLLLALFRAGLAHGIIDHGKFTTAVFADADVFLRLANRQDSVPAHQLPPAFAGAGRRLALFRGHEFAPAYYTHSTLHRAAP